MALPMLRGCHRLPSTLSITRFFLNESVVLNRCGKTRLPPPPHVHPYSSDRGHKQKQKMVFIDLPNPFIWFRSRIYCFLIRAYFDKEFNIEEFVVGAKQAFTHVSRLLSQCRFEALEGLVAKDLIEKLEEKCNLLTSDHKEALSADPDNIMHTAPRDVGIYYDDDGRKFVSILMHFWYLTNARIPGDATEGARVFHISGKGEAETKRMLSANYEFQREFTKGVPPEWTITRIEHSKLLD